MKHRLTLLTLVNEKIEQLELSHEALRKCKDRNVQSEVRMKKVKMELEDFIILRSELYDQQYEAQ